MQTLQTLQTRLERRRRVGFHGGVDAEPSLLRTPAAEAVRRIALAHLEEASAACARLAQDADPDALHDFRVAIRRLRSVLRAWRPELEGALKKRHRRRLRDLQQATGGARDAEVALAWVASQEDLTRGQKKGHAWLRERIEQRLKTESLRASREVPPEFEAVRDTLRERLGRLTITLTPDPRVPVPSFAEALAGRAKEHGAEVAKALVHFADTRDVADAHAARIQGKRLRYLLEPAAAEVPEAQGLIRRLKDLQDLLGEANDARVLKDETARALEDAAAANARRLHALVQAHADVGEPVRRATRLPERAGLLELTRRLERRQRALLAQVEAKWMGSAKAEVEGEVEALVQALLRYAHRGLEIERTWLLSGPPEFPPGAQSEEIVQGYLPTRAFEERVRRTSGPSGTTYVRTWKSGDGRVRKEAQEPIDESLFASLWPLTQGRRIHKRRTKVQEGSYTYEVDEFLDRDLWIAEVELAHAGEAPDLPAWLAGRVVREVTDDPAYGNAALAARGGVPAS